MTQSRRMLVLRAVVEDYIRSQEPVGSAALSKERDLGVSSAKLNAAVSIVSYPARSASRTHCNVPHDCSRKSPVKLP